MLGAGSVAKAVVYGLRQLNVDVVITSRTFENARELAEATDSRAVEWDSRYSVKIDVLCQLHTGGHASECG